MTPAATRAEVLELSQERTMTNVKNLARAIGVGQNVIYDEIARGAWTKTRVLRVGRKILIPTADILSLVGGEGERPPDGHTDSPGGEAA